MKQDPEVTVRADLRSQTTGPTASGFRTQGDARRGSSPAARSRGGGRTRSMGCSISGLNALYDAATGGGDVWINERRFRVLRQIGEGGFAFVYLVREQQPASDAAPARRHSAHVSEDGTYAMKKVLIQSKEQLDLVREEIRVSSLFNHPNLLPLLDHAIIAVKGDWSHEAYLLFPVHLDGTLFDNANVMLSRKEFYSTADVLQIFRQMCEGLKHMHSFDPPYAHNDVKPGNVLITRRKGQAPVATLMDFGSARPARKQIRSRSEALQLQEWAAEHCSAPYRAPELWDCPSHADIDERTDIWSLGCTLYAIINTDNIYSIYYWKSDYTIKN
ncbi:unnamed protein product [Urochloa decumbens]|uniref:non-specific serine/threonine protein kinase n=1 Tax=Urochloa decumbens TaxID=240449 RepID=A0ABC9FGI1_9POAL